MEPSEYMKNADRYRPSMWAKGKALLEATDTALGRGVPIPVEKVGAVIESFPAEHRAFLVRALELFAALHSHGKRPNTGYVSFFGAKKENTWDMWEKELPDGLNDPK